MFNLQFADAYSRQYGSRWIDDMINLGSVGSYKFPVDKNLIDCFHVANSV